MPIRHASITVPSVAAIDQVHVAELQSGTALWAEAEAKLFLLDKTSGATANGTSVIAAIAGSPIAGASAARWIEQQAQSSASPWYAELGTNQSTSSLVAVDLLSLAIVKTSAGRIKINADAAIFVTSPASGAPSDPLANLLLTVDGTLAKGCVFGQFPRQVVIGSDMLLFHSIGFTDVQTVTAGAHTIALRWYVTAADLILTCDALTAPTDSSAAIVVEEISG
jgi:hypothetical protein